jgi:hypothetical protein
VLSITKDDEDIVNADIQVYDTNNNLISTVEAKINYTDSTVTFGENGYDPTDYTALDITNIINGAAYWSSTLTKINAFEETKVEFPYNPDYPLYIILTGDYNQNSPNTNKLEHSTPAIIESKEYTGYKKTGVYPTPINALIRSDEGYGELNLSGINQSETITFQKLPLPVDFGTDSTTAIRGILLEADVGYTDELICTAKLWCRNLDQEEIEGTRSIILNEDDVDTTENEMSNKIIIGGEYDTWGIPIKDLTNLDDAEIQLIFNNTHATATEDNTVIQLNNTNVTFYANDIELTDYTIYIEGEDVRYYGMFIKDIKIPYGLQTSVKYLTAEGTDLNTPINQTITDKTIEIEFDLDDCNLIDSTSQMIELAQLFTNTRDNMNKPVPKKVVFSHMPGYYAEYIMEDSFDDNININSYEGKLKLTIPTGTFYKLDDTVTANTGNVNSITNVKPVVDVYCTESTVEIEETVSHQKFTMTYPDFAGKVLRVDCENRRAYLLTNEDDDEPVNISGSVDWSSDWFSLHGEYDFSITGGLLLSVTYTERN